MVYFKGIPVVPLNEGFKTAAAMAPLFITQSKEVTAAEVAKEAARINNIVGRITVGLGAVSCVWDGYQISEALEGSKEGTTTALGEALRRIVEEESKERTRNRGYGVDSLISELIL